MDDTFPEQLATAVDGANAEGEEEGEWWVFYCSEVNVEQLLELTRSAIPKGWTAKIVPVPAGDEAAARIEVSRL